MPVHIEPIRLNIAKATRHIQPDTTVQLTAFACYELSEALCRALVASYGDLDGIHLRTAIWQLAHHINSESRHFGPGLLDALRHTQRALFSQGWPSG